MPGKLIQSLKVTETANPVILIDEIDKMGRSMNGDPSSALLEVSLFAFGSFPDPVCSVWNMLCRCVFGAASTPHVPRPISLLRLQVLDPEQNSSFLDHYLDVGFDISKALFVCTANELDTIPRPLLDRMEVINMSGYVMNEKVEIAKQYLLPKCQENAGLEAGQVVIKDDAMRCLIRSYAREARVGNLQQQLQLLTLTLTLIGGWRPESPAAARENPSQGLFEGGQGGG